MHFILPLQYSNVSSGHFMLRSRHICRISSSIFETGNVTLTCLQSTVRHFYRAMLCIARTMLSQDVRPSARLSVTRHAGITSKRLKILFHLRVAIPFYFFRTKPYDNILTGIPLTGPWNAGVWKIAIFDQYLALSRKRYKLGEWNANRKPYLSFRMVPFSITLNDP